MEDKSESNRIYIILPFGNFLTYLQYPHGNDMSKVNKIIKKLKKKENLISGILICISCGSDKVIRDSHTLQCKMCDYINSYEAAT